MLGNTSQQQRIDDLTEAVNILTGQVAALMAYVAAVTPPLDPADVRAVQGLAQGLAPGGLLSRTHPKLAASQAVEKIVSVSQQRPTHGQP